jgi:hypothetical protein
MVLPSHPVRVVTHEQRDAPGGILGTPQQ